VSARAWALADRLVGALSLACAVHCALGPLRAAALAAAGAELLAGDGWHSLFLALAALSAAANVGCSWRRHRSAWVWPLLGAALLCLGAGELAEEGPHGAALGAAGGLLLAATLELNRRCRNACGGRPAGPEGLS
jgi:hypothetical protein